MTDITAPQTVELEIRNDGKVVWVNVDGVCELRACRIASLVVIDHRKTHNQTTNEPTNINQ